jgi:uncharacterized protein (TIGR02246 family)
MTAIVTRVTAMSDDERAIRTLVESWMEASRAGDLETVLSLMADDVVFMVPGQKPFGKAAFKATSEGMKNVQIEGKAISRRSGCSAIGRICATTSR